MNQENKRKDGFQYRDSWQEFDSDDSLWLGRRSGI